MIHSFGSIEPKVFPKNSSLKRISLECISPERIIPETSPFEAYHLRQSDSGS